MPLEKVVVVAEGREDLDETYAVGGGDGGSGARLDGRWWWQRGGHSWSWWQWGEGNYINLSLC